MRVLLLSAGPSLRDYDPAAEVHADLVIGINRAVELHQVDWWCCGDYQAFDLITPKDKQIPHLCTMNASADWLEHHRPELWPEGKPTSRTREPCRIRRWTDMVQEYNPAWGVDTYSAPMGLLLAYELGAKEIICFGVDMQGNADCAGHEDLTNARGPDRWEKERKIWQDMVTWLAAKGITVTCQPPPTPTQAATKKGKTSHSDGNSRSHGGGNG